MILPAKLFVFKPLSGKEAKKIAFLLFSFAFLFNSEQALANDTLFRQKEDRIGLMVGYGFQYLGQVMGNDDHRLALKTKYNYRVTFLQLQYYISISNKKTFGMDLLVQPQYNFTKLKAHDSDGIFQNGYEIGSNLGLVIRETFFSDRVTFYCLISSGPHYVSRSPQRQANGFIFSDNFSAGINLKLYKKLYFDIRPGFRHISNAGFRAPNGGVNTMAATTGFLVAL